MASRNASEFPKFDLDGMVAIQRANVETMVQAQKILTDAAQSIAKLQAGYVNDFVSQMQASFSVKEPRKPETWLTDAQRAVEKAVNVAQEQFHVGTKAQTEVVDLVTKRAAASFDQSKSVAA